MTYTQPQHRRRIWPWALGVTLAALALGCGGGAAASGDDSGTTSTTKSATKAAPAKTQKVPGLNDAARDGDFQFTVTGVSCGADHVGSDLLGEQAQGQFCLVSIQIKNISKSAQTFTDSAQKAYDAKKVEYSVDSTAAIYANPNSQVLFEQINPGNTVKGKILFDVPKGTKLTSLELHDSLFSGGVKVNLK